MNDQRATPPRRPRSAGAVRVPGDGGGGMTNGQLQQLRDLSKCYIKKGDGRSWVELALNYAVVYDANDPLDKSEEATLRRLTHQYRNQIVAMKRNRRANDA